MFVDKVTVKISAGDGGKGAVSFRHEKFIEKGGPDGGDGGNGGDVIAIASKNEDTLANYRYQKRLVAPAGENGSKRKRHGKSGADLELSVPVGTVITNESGEVIADMSSDGQREIIALGGKGGFGNAHFVSSTRQAPRIAEKGEKGEAYEATLELKMIADVGLVGLPNAGKSTLLASLSNAHPEIANYPFTTLRPNLGMVDVSKGQALLFADIPGLIEGASKGKGLGDDFLRHVERTNVLLHLIDIYNDDIVKAYETIQQELKEYQVDLSKKPQIVALNKIDGLDDEIVADKKRELAKALPKSSKVFAISAKSKKGLDELLRETSKLAKARRKQAEKKDSSLPILRFEAPEESWQVNKTKDGFVVTGTKIERFAARTDFDNPHGVQRLRDIMFKMGIMQELERQGIDVGETIKIGEKYQVEY